MAAPDRQDIPTPSGEQIHQTAKLVLLAAFQGNANIHRDILQHGRERFLGHCVEFTRGYDLTLVDAGDIFDVLMATRPPWLHELPDGTLLDEQGFVVAGDEDDRAAAAKILQASYRADEAMARIQAEYRRAARRA